MVRRAVRGFTLVELLVVMAIIGVLSALLLPAVMAARGAASRVECANNLRQLALACLQHESQLRYLPSGGWGNKWAGDSTLGFGAAQPGSWLFSILPFVDELNIHRLGQGSTSNTSPAAIARQNQIVVTYFHCPARRAPDLFPFDGDKSPALPWFYNSASLNYIVRADYAANCGDFGYALMWHPDHDGPPPPLVDSFDWDHQQRGRTGVIYVRSEITSAMIPDGLSKTILIGEKQLHIDEYESGKLGNDNQGAYAGFNHDNQRVINENHPPLPDSDPRTAKLWATTDVSPNFTSCFGSAHQGLWQAAFCDGSVTALTYTIDLQAAKLLANRGDGKQGERPN